MQKIIHFIILLSFFFIPFYSIAQSLLDKEIESTTIRLLEKMDIVLGGNIAVADFSDTDGMATRLGRYLSDEFSFALTNAEKNFNVIDRSRMKFLLEEQGLAEDGLIDPNTVAKLGKIKGIDAIITGRLTPASDYIRIFINVIDLETAKVLAAVKGDISKSPTIIELSKYGEKEISKQESKSSQTIKEEIIYPASPLEKDNGLIAFYPFNGNANDESENENDGKVYGATLTLDRFGNNNSAYDFDGYDDYIEINVNSIEFKAIENFTLSLWINISSYNDTILFKTEKGGSIFNSSGWGPLDGFDLNLYFHKFNRSYLTGYMTKYYRPYNKLNEITASVNFEIPSNGIWKHFLFMRRDNEIYIYVDGQLRSKEINDISIIPMYHALYIGAHCHTDLGCELGKDNKSFNGKIDDLAIYNRALSDKEILQLNNNK